MTPKAQELARKEIGQIVQRRLFHLDQSNAQTIANSIVNWIDWDNKEHMHKGLDQIVAIYFDTKQINTGARKD